MLPRVFVALSATVTLGALFAGSNFGWFDMHYGAACAQGETAEATGGISGRIDTESNTHDADQHVKEGERCAKFGNWTGAADEFAKAVKANPANIVAYYNLGVAYAHLKKYDQAAEMERRAIEMNPEYTLAYIELGSILERTGDLAGAEEAEAKAVSLSPNNKIAKENLSALLVKRASRQVNKMPGEDAARKGLGPAAMESEALLRMNVFDRVKQGNTHFQQGEMSKAKETLGQAAKDFPWSSVAHANFGVVLGATGDLVGEIREERKALEIDSANVAAQVNLGWALSRKGKWEEAETAYKSALALNANLLEAKIGLAVATVKLGQVDKGLESLRQIGIELSGNALPSIATGALLTDLGRLDEADAALQEALRLEPNNREAQQRVAALLLQKGQWAAAAEKYQALLTPATAGSNNSGGNCDNLVGLGLALLKSGDKQGSQDKFRQALEIEPDNACAHAGLGLTLLSQGDNKQAMEEAREALMLDPKQELAQALISKLNNHKASTKNISGRSSRWF
jgi:superkiller protein 3